MHSKFRSLTKLFRRANDISRSLYPAQQTYNPSISIKSFPFSIPNQQFHQLNPLTNSTIHHKSTNSSPQNPLEESSTENESLKIQTLLKIHSHKPTEEIERRLSKCTQSLSEELILNVLKRHRSEWKPAYTFFKWVQKSDLYKEDTTIYNEILDILGRSKQFDEFHQVLDEMSSRKNSFDQRTYAIMVNRYAAAHKVDEAIEFFHKVEDFGLDQNLIAFQTLLLSLCRYKHVEAAELFFRNKKSEFTDDIKTWNIILNGWCVIGSLPDAKRFWRDILASNCKPDRFTYGIFLNSLTKSGKISTATKLLRSMWDKGFSPDAVICNSVIDGLCFKKRIPEALVIFREMNDKGCAPNAATYNTLVKYLCKIGRMEKVCELVKEMEELGGICSPNDLTYNHLLKAAKSPGEVDVILEKMEKSECEIILDTYNLVLRLSVEWGDEERVRKIWDEMARRGVGPDRRSYTILIHGMYDGGILRGSLKYFDEMVMKGMVPEPRTKLLVDEMKYRLNGMEGDRKMRLRNFRGSVKKERKKR